MASKKSEVRGIDRAIAVAGSQAQIAADLGVTQQAVSVWHAQGFAPVKRAVKMEDLYGVPRAAMISPKLLGVLNSTVTL